MVWFLGLWLGWASAGTYLPHTSYEQALKAIARAPVVLLTVASEHKVHGPHLPLNTDAVLAGRLARDLAASSEVAVLPNLNIGWYPQFARFKLVNYSPELAQRAVRETLEGVLASGAKRVMVLNFDVQQSSGLPIMIALNELARERRTPFLLLSWYDFVNDPVIAMLSGEPGHADELETSLMLYLDESLVDRSRLMDAPLVHHAPGTGYRPVVFDTAEAKSSWSIPGQLGSSKKASKELGEKLYRQILENIKRRLDEFARVKA